MSSRPSGWILPDGSWIECSPWEHILTARALPFVLSQRESHLRMQALWDGEDDEALRSVFAEIGLVKVCYHLVDADYLTPRQLTRLQELYGLHRPEDEVDFIGRIKVKLQVRILLKLRSPDRLNNLV